MSSESNRPSLMLPSADAVQPDHPAQWWYWSGQLRADSGRRYGFQTAFFAAEAVRGLLWGQMAHWALVDLDAGEFASGSRIWLGAPERIEGRFALESPRGGVSAFGGGGRDRLRLRLGELELDLRASGGPVVEHYEGRAHDYAFGGYSYYYSRPRMAGVGLIRRGATRESVRGEVWFDRQFGELSSALSEGWQWLSIHLEDGEQLMLFSFNRERSERIAAITDAQGRTRWLGPDEVRLEPIERWTSPRSGIEYPCAWRLRTDAHQLELRAALREQEMNGAAWLGPVYWEGACEVSGSHRGVAYVELLGSLGSGLASATRIDASSSRLRRGLAKTLRHPTIALGLATGVGHLAAHVAALRPSFADPSEAAIESSGATIDLLLRRASQRSRARADELRERAPQRRRAVGE